MRKSAFYKDILCTLKNNFSRFIAITVMATLGTGVFAGFAVGCLDVLRSADDFYHEQNNYDIQIVSALGLTNGDVAAVSGIDGVRTVFGNVSMEVKAERIGGNSALANLTTLDGGEMNKPYILEGVLPIQSGQIAVNSKFIDDTGLRIGNMLTLTQADIEDSTAVNSMKPQLAVNQYKITAVVQDPLDISNAEGGIASVSFSNNSKYTMYTTSDCIKSNIYSAIYLTISDAGSLDSYSEQYQQLVEKISSAIQTTIQEKRQQERYDEVVKDSNDQISDNEKLLTDKMAGAEKKMASAQKKIDKGWIQFHKGTQKLRANETKLISGEKTFADARKIADKKFVAAQKEIDNGLKKLNTAEVKLNKKEKEVLKQFTAYEKQAANSRLTMNKQKSKADKQLLDTIALLPSEARTIWNTNATRKIWSDMIADGKQAAPYLLAVKQGDVPTKAETDAYNATMIKLQKNTESLAAHFVFEGTSLTQEQITAFSNLAVTYGTLNYSQDLLNKESATLASQKKSAMKELAAARKQIKDSKAKLVNGQKELNQNKAQLAQKQAEIEQGKKKITDAKQKLISAKTDLKNGQKELNENKQKYKESIAKAQRKLADAKVKVNEIAVPKWYVWDRRDNESFAGLKSDMDFIQAVTKAFPIIFFLVAVLICLSSMTRMVEEDRGLIGTYKSLGYSNFAISLKYILYAVLSCVIGGILGSMIGFIGLPMVIKSIFSNMYILPMFELHFYLSYAFGGFGLFLIGIAGATAVSCAAMLRRRPAELMRPKAPKAGSRILMERIPFLWKRLNFLRKITCRNLFRYKKRAIMTIVGILGCTMLIVLGFGLRDTIGGLISDQFDTVTLYDAITVTDNLNKDEMNMLAKEWISLGKVTDVLQLQISSMTLRSKSGHTDITVMIIPDNADLNQYIHLRDSTTEEAMLLPPKGIAVTQNAAKQLALTNGDTVSLLNEENLQRDFPVAFVATNYAGNYVFVSESTYQAAFGDYAGTSFLLNLTPNIDGQQWLNALQEDDRILTVSSSQTAIDSFNEINIDMVIYLLIGMSAVLALAVLFTLSNININERERELATIKVLGFQRKEVYSYVNKETMILSLIGILCGLPAGYGMTYAIMGNLSMADITFKVRVSPVAYLIAALLTLVFAILVNKITNKGLRKINMVEALKSVE